MERCTLPAGHDGDHEVVKRFSDDECWTPGQATAPVPVPAVQHLVEGPVLSTKCVLCEHDHGGMGKCNKMDGDFACDCTFPVN